MQPLVLAEGGLVDQEKSNLFSILPLSVRKISDAKIFSTKNINGKVPAHKKIMIRTVIEENENDFLKQFEFVHRNVWHFCANFHKFFASNFHFQKPNAILENIVAFSNQTLCTQALIAKLKASSQKSFDFREKIYWMFFLSTSIHIDSKGRTGKE